MVLGIRLRVPFFCGVAGDAREDLYSFAFLFFEILDSFVGMR